MNRFKTDLRFKLFSFFLFLGISFLFIGMIVTYSTGASSLKDVIGKRFQEIAGQTAEKTSLFIDREFQKLQIFSANLKMIEGINKINKNRIANKNLQTDIIFLLNQFMSNNKDEFKSIVIADKRGNIIAATDKREVGNHSDKPWFWWAAYNGISYISDFYTAEDGYSSTGSREYFVDIVAPVIDIKKAEVVGVIKGTLSGEWMTRSVVNTWIGNTGHTMLITSEGIVAICPLEYKEGDKDAHKVDAETMKVITANQSGWENVEDNTHDAANAVAGYAPVKLSQDIYQIKKYNWYIFVTQDPSETYSILYSTLWRMLIFGILLVGVLSIGSYFITQRIVGPIIILKNGAESLTKGNGEAVPLPVLSEDEIGRLTQSFNTMAAAIRERTDEIQRKSREWDNTFNSITDLLVIYDKNYIIIKVNRAFAQRFNASPEAMIGKRCFDVFPKSGTNWVIGLRGASESSEIFQEEVYDPDTGTTFMVTIFPWLDENSQIAGSVLIARDITEYKRLQKQLLHSEKLAAVGELASGVAHELNNPLTGVMGFAELLLQKEKDKKKRDIINKMLNAAERSAKIVQNLLFFVRKEKEEDAPLDINNLILNTLELKYHEFEVNNVEVIKRLMPLLPKISGNYNQLQQVMLNILNNAQNALLEVEQTEREIIIETRLKSSDDGRPVIEVSIKDSGPGIPQEHLYKIFDPFFTTKAPGKGTGLGLSVSYGIIKKHNGRIYAKSDLGEGAAFYIELPVIAG